MFLLKELLIFVTFVTSLIILLCRAAWFYWNYVVGMVNLMGTGYYWFFRLFGIIGWSSSAFVQASCWISDLFVTFRTTWSFCFLHNFKNLRCHTNHRQNFFLLFAVWACCSSYYPTLESFYFPKSLQTHPIHTHWMTLWPFVHHDNHHFPHHAVIDP